MVANTRDASIDEALPSFGGRPGVVIVYSGTSAVTIPLELSHGRVALGRIGGAALELPDDRVSRQHAEIQVTGDRWTVRDLRSRNGTFVDGVQVRGSIEVT